MSIEEIDKKQRELQDQLHQVKVLATQIEAQIQRVYAEIQREKIAQASCQDHFIDEVVDLNITHEKVFLDEREETLETEAPPIILPKPLAIKGYENVRNILWRHIKELISEGYSDQYTFNLYIEKVARCLSYIGKEVVFEKVQPVENDEILKEWREIIETCRKINQYKKNNDQQGYIKMQNFFYQKQPKPNNPFDRMPPIDLFTQALSPYIDACYLMYYLNAYKREFSSFNESEYENIIKEKGWREADFFKNFGYAIVVEEVEINDIFVSFMEMLYMLYTRGMKMLIVPVLEENIIYRPRRVAQDGKYFSLYYYDDYVEDPQMVTEEDEKSLNSSYYSSGGSTFVSGHYRSGYWRNGRYVSGGYVKGHYRS